MAQHLNTVVTVSIATNLQGVVTITAATYMAIAAVLLSLDISYLIALSYHQYTQHDSDY